MFGCRSRLYKLRRSRAKPTTLVEPGGICKGQNEFNSSFSIEFLFKYFAESFVVNSHLNTAIAY